MNWALFIAGFIGALAPEVVRLYRLRRQPRAFHSYYFAVSAIYALLGGYVATIAPGVTAAWWAFCVGAGLNAVVSTAARWGGALVDGVSRDESARSPVGTSRGAPPSSAAHTEHATAWRRFVQAF